MITSIYSRQLLGVIASLSKRPVPQIICAFFRSSSNHYCCNPGPRTHVQMPKLRTARPDDFPQVTAMTADDSQFARIDYLPSSFHDIIENPYAKCLVAEVDGRLTAFSYALCGVDDGTSIVMGGGRTVKDYRGRGNIVLFTRIIKDMHPNSVQLAYTYTKPASRHEGLSTIIEQRHEYPFSATEEGLSRQNRASMERVSAEGNSVDPLTIREFCDLFHDDNLNEYLYPNGRFFMDMLIAMPLPSNEKFVQQIKDNLDLFISRSLLREEGTQQTIEPANKKPRFHGLLSYNTWHPCVAGFSSKIQLYGNVDDGEELRAHLRAHAQCFRDKGLWGVVRISVAMNSLSLGEAEFKRICRETGFTATDYPEKTVYILVFEEMFQKIFTQMYKKSML